MTITREEVPALYDADVMHLVKDTLTYILNAHYRFNDNNDSCLSFVSLSWLLRRLCNSREIDIIDVRVELTRWNGVSCRWEVLRTWR